jgi:hypothetical protein
MKTNLELPIKLGLFFSFLTFLAFIPKADDPINKLTASLQRWTDSIPQEKVYLHMDKPYYVLGDTIWFKGYVTIGSRHQLSALSGALHVDLISEKDSVLQSLKLPITSGMVIGDFILGDAFKEGSYRIRAYTQWMRNTGDDYFYDHTFTVGDIANNNIVTKADYQYKDINGKPVLTATLNYSDDDGKPIAGKDVHYQIVIDKKVAWSTSAKTDLNGNIPVRISNENHVDLSGAYITTTFDDSRKTPLTRDFPIKAALSQSDVQFFPESGSLVNGITSRVAFKAIGIDGLGLNIKAKITDNDNKEVADIETLHAGMGNFLLRPEAGKTYSANIVFADGTAKTVALPKAINEGYVLNVYQPNKDSVLVRISASAKMLPTAINLIVHSNGEIMSASAVKIEKPTTSIWLEKSSFPTGIAQFTIFNINGEPLNERIAFISSNDKMQLGIKTIKSNFNSKERILVNLDVKDSKGTSTFGNFSVAVIDETKVPYDENKESTIFSNLLLTSDLKGYVEKPNYYFVNRSDKSNLALDNLMLTQGYRRFSWKELNHTVNTTPTFPAEGLLTSLSGKVTTLNNKPLTNAIINLLSPRAKIAKVTSSGIDGRFKFDGILLMDSIKFALQATKASSNNVRITMDSIPKLKMTNNNNLADVSTNIIATLKAYIDNGKKEDDINEKLGRLDQVHRLREVNIRANKIVVPTYKAQGMYRIPEGHADRTYKMNIPEDAPILALYLQGQGLHGVTFTPNVLGEFTPNLQVFLDGRKLAGYEVVQVFNDGLVDGESIDKIDVVNHDLALIAMLGGPSMLIYTKKDYVRKRYTPGITNITPKGFNKVREFYSPKYDRPSDANKLPDLRTTVYWNPYLKTDADGKTSFSYYNADGPGTYKVIVEGINANGELGRQVYRYTIGAY